MQACMSDSHYIQQRQLLKGAFYAKKKRFYKVFKDTLYGRCVWKQLAYNGKNFTHTFFLLFYNFNKS